MEMSKDGDQSVRSTSQRSTNEVSAGGMLKQLKGKLAGDVMKKRIDLDV